jgi:hypothetical protein
MAVFDDNGKIVKEKRKGGIKKFFSGLALGAVLASSIGVVNASTATVNSWNALVKNMMGIPGSDRIIFWDQSANGIGFLTIGSNLSITGTTLNATGGGGGGGGDLVDGDYGDITVSGTGTVMTIDNGVVSNAKIRDSAGLSVLGRSGSTTGAIADITCTANQVLRVNSAGTSLACGAVNIQSSTAVTGILPLDQGGTQSNLTDPNADRIFFWDDSAGGTRFLTLGTGLSITGTTIDATASGSDPYLWTPDASPTYDEGDYGTVTMAVTTATPKDIGTITFSAGDFTVNSANSVPYETSQLNIYYGDKITFTGLSEAANNGVEFTVLDVGGTSNRTVTVTPAPTAMTTYSGAYTITLGDAYDCGRNVAEELETFLEANGGNATLPLKTDGSDSCFLVRKLNPASSLHLKAQVAGRVALKSLGQEGEQGTTSGMAINWPTGNDSQILDVQTDVTAGAITSTNTVNRDDKGWSRIPVASTTGFEIGDWALIRDSVHHPLRIDGAGDDGSFEGSPKISNITWDAVNSKCVVTASASHGYSATSKVFITGVTASGGTGANSIGALVGSDGFGRMYNITLGDGAGASTTTKFTLQEIDNSTNANSGTADVNCSTGAIAAGTAATSYSPSDFGDATFSTGGTITFTTGDPLASNIPVGAIIRMAGATTSTNNKSYTITATGGTSNRTVTVTPAPSANETVTSGWSFTLVPNVRTWTFTTQTGLGFDTGQVIVGRSSSDYKVYIKGSVTSYNSGTGVLVVDATTAVGTSGTSTWNFNFPMHGDSGVSVGESFRVAGVDPIGGYIYANPPLQYSAMYVDDPQLYHYKTPEDGGYTGSLEGLKLGSADPDILDAALDETTTLVAIFGVPEFTTRNVHCDGTVNACIISRGAPHTVHYNLTGERLPNNETYDNTQNGTKTVTAATVASPAVFTSTSHGYSDNSRIGFKTSELPAGWEALGDEIWHVDSLSANTYSLRNTYGSYFDSSALPAWSGTTKTTNDVNVTGLGYLVSAYGGSSMLEIRGGSSYEGRHAPFTTDSGSGSWNSTPQTSGGSSILQFSGLPTHLSMSDFNSYNARGVGLDCHQELSGLTVNNYNVFYPARGVTFGTYEGRAGQLRCSGNLILNGINQYGGKKAIRYIPFNHPTQTTIRVTNSNFMDLQGLNDSTIGNDSTAFEIGDDLGASTAIGCSGMTYPPDIYFDNVNVSGAQRAFFVEDDCNVKIGRMNLKNVGSLGIVAPGASIEWDSLHADYRGQTNTGYTRLSNAATGASHSAATTSQLALVDMLYDATEGTPTVIGHETIIDQGSNANYPKCILNNPSTSGTYNYYLGKVTVRNESAVTALSKLCTGTTTISANTTGFVEKTTVKNDIDLSNLGLNIRDTANDNKLTIKDNENLTADRTLSLVMGDADRSLTLTGNTSLTGTNTGDQSLFSTFAVSGQSDVVADTTTDTLTLAAGSGITLTTNASTDTVTITNAASGSTAATSSDVDTGTDTTKFVSSDALAGSTQYGIRYLTFNIPGVLGTGDGTFANGKCAYLPAGFGGRNLVSVMATNGTVGTTSGTTTFQIRNATQTADMLTTKITIDSTEQSSLTAATAAVIDAANDDVATSDAICVDIDVISGGATEANATVLLGFQLP